MTIQKDCFYYKTSKIIQYNENRINQQYYMNLKVKNYQLVINTE